MLSLNLHGNSDKYDVFNLTDADIATTLNNSIVVSAPNNKKLTADITFGCADIKYKNGVLKFCECGDGICMSLRPTWIDINGTKQWLTAPYWGIFWHYLAQFKLPMWLVGDAGPLNAYALSTLALCGGKNVRTIADLERDITFKALRSSNSKPSKNIRDYKGIVVYRSVSGRDSALFKRFKKMYPEFLFVNNHTVDDITNKERTYQAFCAAGMHRYVPLSQKYSTVYSKELVQSILQNIATDKLVVKPEHCSLACGVNVIDRADLDALLSLILKNKNQIKRDAHRCFAYWRNAKDRAFFVQEYASSKLLVKDNKTYDPTMRIVFFMHHDQEKITVTVVGGFWKIPVKPLEDPQASLTEKHVTIAHAGAYYTGMLCDRNDWREIEKCLHEALPALYGAMMQRFTKAL